jgi:hypothetical protein
MTMFWVGVVAYVVGSMADLASSVGGREAVPLWRRRDGTFNPYTNAAFKVGMALLVMYLLRGDPEECGGTLLLGGLMYTGAAIWNLRVRRKSDGN